jgi:hypothetical protein
MYPAPPRCTSTDPERLTFLRSSALAQTMQSKVLGSARDGLLGGLPNRDSGVQKDIGGDNMKDQAALTEAGNARAQIRDTTTPEVKGRNAPGTRTQKGPRATLGQEDSAPLNVLHIDLSDAIERITQAGLEVMGGFIVGFDTDDEEVFPLQREFFEQQPMPLAMVGMLMALPGTALWRRLEAEGRMRKRAGGDQFCRPNFVPVMDEQALLEGYARFMKWLYSPEAYYSRCLACRRSHPPAKAVLEADAQGPGQGRWSPWN